MQRMTKQMQTQHLMQMENPKLQQSPLEDRVDSTHIASRKTGANTNWQVACTRKLRTRKSHLRAGERRSWSAVMI
jgi:hypothetical protein